MATKVFTSADMTIGSISSGTGADITAAATNILAFDGDTGVYSQSTNTDVDNFGTSEQSLTIAIIVSGSLTDDASLPADITVTNINIAYTGTLLVGAGCPARPEAGGAVGIIVGSGDDLTGVILELPGAVTATSSYDNDPVTYLGGTTRADLFAGTFYWLYLGAWGNYTPPGGPPIPFVAHDRQAAVDDWTVTITYTVPTPPEVTSIKPSFGSVNGGQHVTIRGLGFTGATVVEFGGTATTFTVVSDTEGTAVTPAHASGTVDVEVLGVATGTDLYTYTLDRIRLPPMPIRTPMTQGGGKRG